MADPAPWSFALHVHAAPGVERFCLSLQDGLQADVNLLLCAAWCGATGRGLLGDADLARLDAAIAPLRDEVVARLRAARRWLKPVAATSPRLAAMRERIKAIGGPRARGKRLDRKQLRRMARGTGAAAQHARLWRRRFLRA